MEKSENTKTTEILLKGEEAENRLLDLYVLLLDYGVENCIREAKREMFRSSIRSLYSDSSRHKETIKRILNKYK